MRVRLATMGRARMLLPYAQQAESRTSYSSIYTCQWVIVYFYRELAKLIRSDASLRRYLDDLWPVAEALFKLEHLEVKVGDVVAMPHPSTIQARSLSPPNTANAMAIMSRLTHSPLPACAAIAPDSSDCVSSRNACNGFWSRGAHVRIACICHAPCDPLAIWLAWTFPHMH